MALVLLILAKDIFTVPLLNDILIWAVFLATIFSGMVYVLQNKKVFST